MMSLKVNKMVLMKVNRMALKVNKMVLTKVNKMVLMKCLGLVLEEKHLDWRL